ncbi:hypothetical protein GCM10023322_57730 [Rugosimonospora acidiphila]|uniref:GH26 domain-containing protein n=1 Tax=Rugosimonospora acidiphila TaxID=556531 RepID=A0ABP9SEP4_9ACTN
MTAMVNRRFGCYSPTRSNVYNFDTLERQVGRAFNVYSTFISFDSTTVTHSEIRTASDTGHDILLAWQPSRTVGLRFSDILAGSYDRYIDGWFDFLAAFPTTVYIRFGHEMNGSYTPWSPLYTGAVASSQCTSPAQFAQVWRYLVARQRANKRAINIRWYFCPNVNDVPVRTPYPLETFYPGSAYVDVVGYDSYNGLSGQWLSPLQTLAGKTGTTANAYDRVGALRRDAGVWVGETGCVDAGDPKDINPPVYDSHSKAQWWTDLFAIGDDLPRLTTICFFNETGSRNWRFDSSPQSLASFQRNFANRMGRPVTRSRSIGGR